MSQNLVEDYSGIVLNQNQRPTNPTDSLLISNGAWRYQEFFLPDNYTRGTDASEQSIPPLTGTQLFVKVVDQPTINWKVEYDVFGIGWIQVASGTTNEIHVVGSKVWIDLPFDAPVPVNSDMSTSRFRLGIQTSDTVEVWFSTPNPLATRFASARAADGTTAIQSGGQDVSFLFRVLGLTADEGTDFLGNSYRSAVALADASNVSSLTGSQDAIWLSKPNPSRFAVENLYFDMRKYRATTYTGTDADPLALDDTEVVIDSVLVDPITPNVYFHIYYTSEGDPGADDDDWDFKLWKRVPQTFKATKRESHVLPEPIRAKYIKVEFSHLQAQHYAPGQFAKPTAYKKHPKWVLDYFLARLNADISSDGLLPGRVAVIYDALDLAYNYYLDDLDQSPNQPIEKSTEFQQATSFLDQRNDVSDQVDPQMLEKINLSLAPYRTHISGFADSSTLLGQQSQAVATLDAGGYPVERVSSSTDTSDLADLRSEAVVFESDYPVMFFYLTCRHRYREVMADFDQDKAYFVGVREISFQRDRYATAFDSDQYIEPAGDLLNTERNDFNMVDGIMVI